MNILTVKEYNKMQNGASMMFQTKSGSIRKSGYVVEYKGEYIYRKTLKKAEKVTAQDFDTQEDCPIWWVSELNMSKVEYINQ